MNITVKVEIDNRTFEIIGCYEPETELESEWAEWDRMNLIREDGIKISFGCIFYELGADKKIHELFLAACREQYAADADCEPEEPCEPSDYEYSRMMDSYERSRGL